MLRSPSSNVHASDEALLGSKQQATTPLAVQLPYNSFHSPLPISHSQSSSASSPSRSRTTSGHNAISRVGNVNAHLQPSHSADALASGERSVHSTTGELFEPTLSEEFIHEERRCCGCNFACGRCLSHCWFLTACCGFVLLSSLPRFLALADFIVTALIYSLSFAGRTAPSLSFWDFLKKDIDQYDFKTSGVSLVLLSLVRTLTLFWLYAYRFHLKPAAFFWSTLIMACSLLFILVKFALNTNSHLLALLIWNLCIVITEYTVWILLRRQRIRQPLLPVVAPVVREGEHHEVHAHADSSSLAAPITQPILKQVQSYHRLGDQEERPASESILMSPSFHSHSTAMSTSSSFVNPSSSFPHALSVGSAGTSFPRMSFPQEVEIDAQSLADPDSLFIEIDALVVHYKLSVNGKSILPGEQLRLKLNNNPQGQPGGSPRLEPMPSPATQQDSRLSSAIATEDEPLRSMVSATASSTLSFPTSAFSASSSSSSSVHPTSSPSFTGGTYSPSFHSPVILLHGFGSSLFQWRAIWPELCAQVPIVLAFDRPGFGLTSRPLRDSSGSYGSYVDRSSSRGILVEQPNPYTQEYAVALLEKLVSKLGLNNHHSILLGHSTGGAIALRAAISAPRLFSGVFLISPHIFTEGFPAMIKSLLRTKLGRAITQQLVRSELGEVTMKRAWVDSSRIPPDSVAMYQRILRIKHQMEALIEIASSGTVSDMDPWANLSSRLHQLAGPAAAAAARDEQGNLVSSASADDIHSGGTPVCILHGLQDKLLDVSESSKAYKLLTSEGVHATLIKVEHCGHVPHEEFPALTLDHLFSFMREVEGAQQLTTELNSEDEHEQEEARQM